MDGWRINDEELMSKIKMFADIVCLSLTVVSCLLVLDGNFSKFVRM